MRPTTRRQTSPAASVAHSVVILAGADNLGTLAFARALQDAGHPVELVTPAPSYAARSNAVRQTITVPDPGASPDAFAEAVAAVARRSAGAVVVPITDAATMVLAERRESLPVGTRLAAPDPSVVSKATDKALVAELAATVGLEVPPTTLLTAGGPRPDGGYPLVVKPERSELSGPDGAVHRYNARVARSPEQLDAALAALPEGRGHVQPFLHGDLVGVCGLLWRGSVVGPVHFRVDRVWPPLVGSFSSARTIAEDPAVTARVERLLGALGWEGLFQVDLLTTPEQDTYLLDVNTRVFLTLALPVAAGVNLPARWVEAVVHGEPGTAPPARADVRYRHLANDLRAVLGAARAGELRSALTGALPTLDGAPALFDRSDLGPLGAELSKWRTRRERRSSGGQTGDDGADGPGAARRAEPIGMLVSSESPDRVRDEWEELAEDTGAPPFLHPGWIDAWWTAFGDGTLEILTARERGRLVGALPVVSHHPLRVPAFRAEPLPLSSRPGALRSPANWHSPAWGPVVTGPTAAQALARGLFRRQPPVASGAMLHPAQPGVEELCAAAASAGYDVHLEHLPPSPFTPCDGDWDEYLESRSTKLLSDLRRRERRLREAGEVEFHILDGSASDDLVGLLDEGFRIEPSGWKAERGSSIRSRRETRRFYIDVARWAASRDELRLCFLRIDGQPLAFHFALSHRGAFYLLKGGYDPAWSRYAPSKLLVRHLLEQSFADGHERFEFLGGDEGWKLEWATGTHERVVAHAFAPNFRGTAEGAVVRRLRPLRARARASARSLLDSALSRWR